MAINKFDELRLSLMQELLPLGIGIYEKIKDGGPRDLLETLTSTNAPIEALRKDGELSAEIFRNQLDQVMPGLGNPIMAVDISVDETSEQINVFDAEENDLKVTLERIDANIQLFNEMYNQDNKVQEN